MLNKSVTNSSVSEQGQAVVEYAMILAAILGLLAVMSGFGLSTIKVLNWISANMF
jgi:Flp pilus assembly pilin Flp